MSWRDIEQAPLRDRPRLLLELIVRRLSDRGALPPAGALTVRELTRAAQIARGRGSIAAGGAGSRGRAGALLGKANPAAAGARSSRSSRGKELLSRLEAGVVPDASVPR